MKREAIAVEGAPAGDGLRLELGVLGGSRGLELEFLHDPDRTGTFARVVRGQLCQGDLRLPVAVKLQRDAALSREDSASVTAKFEAERNLHRRLQKDQPPEELERRPLVRQIEVWSDAGECAELPPCVVCSRARHALAPRCPRHPEQVLEVDNFTSHDDQRRLCCRHPGCDNRFPDSPAARRELLLATAGKDTACQGCPLRGGPPEKCLATADFLNFFPSRMLLLELLDLDLDEYLRGRAAKLRSGASARVRDRFGEHLRDQGRRLKQAPEKVQPLIPLSRVVGIFRRVLDGVALLHEQTPPIAHLDLKLENVCVRFAPGGELAVKVIDLGLADDPQALTYLRQASLKRALQSDYAAPELIRPVEEAVRRCAVKLQGDRCEAQLPRNHPGVPTPGDVLALEGTGPGRMRVRVHSVNLTPAGDYLVQATRQGIDEVWVGEPKALPPLTAPREGMALVHLEKHRGLPADVFSLGMTLLALLLDDPNVRAYHAMVQDEGVQNLRTALQAPAAKGLELLPGRALVAYLTQQQGGYLSSFTDCVSRVRERYPYAGPLAEELLGVVVRATVRGDRLFYLAHRGDDARPALRRLREDVEAVAAALEQAQAAAASAARTDEIRTRRLEALKQFEAWHARPPGGTVLPALSAPKQPAEVLAALHFGSAGPAHLQREWDLLRAFRPDPAQRRELLDSLALSIQDPVGREKVLERALGYCAAVPDDQAAMSALMQRYDAAVNAASPDAKDLRRRERYRVLARKARDHREALERLRRFLETLQQRVLPRFGEALAARYMMVFRREEATVSLDQKERDQVQDASAQEVLERLAAHEEDAKRLHKERVEDFARALRQWEALAQQRRSPGRGVLEGVALTRWREPYDRRHGEWLIRHELEREKLGRHLETVKRLLLDPWDTSLERTRNAWMSSPSCTLTRAQLDELDAGPALEVLGWFEADGVGPDLRAEAVFALREIGDA
jgi:hypothetical protein